MQVYTVEGTYGLEVFFLLWIAVILLFSLILEGDFRCFGYCCVPALNVYIAGFCFT